MLNSYITYRKKYIVQNKDNYVTVFSNISDYMLNQHIKGKSTYGIFVNKVSKFLTFDIDLKVKGREWKEYNKWVLNKTIHALEEEGFGQYLNVSFSGSKGYHVDILFNNTVSTEVLEKLGKYIIKKYELDNIRVDGKLIAEVELRGCNNAGVKLPLGINKKSNKFMHYLNDDLNPITQKQFVKNFELKIMKTETLYNLYNSLEIDYIEDIKKVIIEPKPKKDNKEEPKELLKYDKTELDYIVQNEVLKNQGTRNNIIYLVALWCNSHKIKQEEALKKLYRIIDNTPTQLYNNKTSSQWKYEECKKVVEKVYSNNLVLFDVKEVGLNKSILLWIMEHCKTLKQMNIFLCHIFHAIKWGNEGVYFLSESTINKYTGATNKTIEKLNRELVEIGILEVVEKGRYIDLGNGIKKGIATTYKLAIPEIEEIDFKIKNDKINFIKLCKKYLNKKDILAYIPKQTYYDNFK